MRSPFLTSALLSTLALSPLPSAEISTLAGTGTKGFSGDGGPAGSAQLNDPSGLARGADGALYFADTANHRVRKIAAGGTISTVAGNGTRGRSGDGGPATGAPLNEPYEVRFDKAGNLFICERLNHGVRRVDAKTSIISTVAGNGTEGFSGDGGPAENAQLSQPHSMAFDESGDLFVADIGNHRIRKVAMKTGVITTISGTGQTKPALEALPLAGTPLNGPRAIDFDAGGNLWLALREGNAVLKLDLGHGTVQHAAGTGKPGFTGNGGPARAALLAGPKCVSVGPDGNVYFADTESHSIRMIDVKKQTIELIAGTGAKGDGPDGDPLSCKLARPHGVFADPDGTIYIGDSENHRVRVIRR